MTAARAINLAVALIFAYLTSYLDQGVYKLFGVPPLWGQLVCLVALVSCLLLLLTERALRPRAMSLGEGALGALVLAYMAWTAISFLYSSQSSYVVEMLVARLKSALFMVVCIPLFRRPGAGDSLAWAAGAASVLGAAVAIYDFFVPTFTSVPGRGAGFYINPNDTGVMLVALATIASSRLAPRQNFALWAMVITGVSLTFSRGAWLLLGIALVGQAWLGRFGRGKGRIIFFVIVGGLLAGLVVAYFTGALYLLVAGSGLAVFLDPNTVARLGGHGADLGDASSLERRDALHRGLEAFYASPFFGHGVGYTAEWDFPVSTHNMFVLFLAELGVVGAAIFVAMLAVCLYFGRRESRVTVLLFITGSFFSHNMLDQPGPALVLAVVLSLSAQRRASSNQLAPSRGHARDPRGYPYYTDHVVNQGEASYRRRARGKVSRPCAVL